MGFLMGFPPCDPRYPQRYPLQISNLCLPADGLALDACRGGIDNLRMKFCRRFFRRKTEKWMFPKIVVFKTPQNGWFQDNGKPNPMNKWMIWGYHYFLETPKYNPPNMGVGRQLLWRCTFFCVVVASGLLEISKTQEFSHSDLDLHGHVVKKLEQRSECDLQIGRIWVD